MSKTGYYNEQKLTDERLTRALKHVQRRLNNGETWSRKRTGGGITLGKVLPEFGVSTKWSHFFMTFDYTRRITEGRISRERHAFQAEELVKRELRKAGLLAKAEPPKPAPRPETPKTKTAPQTVDVKLAEWCFTDGMEAIRLRWQVREQSARRPVYTSVQTLHRLEPQVYAYEVRETPLGDEYVRRRRLSGDFKQGTLTEQARERIVAEGREQVASMLPGRGLERLEDSLATMRFLMR